MIHHQHDYGGPPLVNLHFHDPLRKSSPPSLRARIQGISQKSESQHVSGHFWSRDSEVLGAPGEARGGSRRLEEALE